MLRQMAFTMRRRIYSAADEDLVAMWPSDPRRRCRRVSAACSGGMALGDTLSSSEALGAHRGIRVPSNLDLTFRDDLIS